MAYGITTGYYDTGGSVEFFKLWLANTRKYAKPEEIIVANAAGKCLQHLGGTWLNLKHNYGRSKKLAPTEQYEGWCLGFMLGAMMCYCNKHDFIYKEQDCLAFGPWISHLYLTSKQTGAPVVVGRFTQHAYRLEQSLVLIKRPAIMTFIGKFLALAGSGPGCPNRPELRFLAIMEKNPGLMAFMKMGCGRDRPVPYDHKCFYAQHLTLPELAELRRRKLLAPAVTKQHDSKALSSQKGG